MPRPDRIKKTVQAFVTVEKWKQLRHIVTEMQRTAARLITQAIDNHDSLMARVAARLTDKRVLKRLAPLGWQSMMPHHQDRTEDHAWNGAKGEEQAQPLCHGNLWSTH